MIAKLEESRTKFAASQTGSFCNDCSPPLYSATALPLKAETFRLLADMADVFFVQCVGYGAFRGGGSRYHHRGCRWLYKGWAKATSRKKKKNAKHRDGEAGNERKNWERQRIETHKTETNTSSKPRKPTLISLSSIAPSCKPKKAKDPSSKPWPSPSPKQKENRKGKVIRRQEQNHGAASFLAISRSR